MFVLTYNQVVVCFVNELGVLWDGQRKAKWTKNICWERFLQLPIKCLIVLNMWSLCRVNTFAW